MFQEFKRFILRGNVIDLAVAVVIAGACGAVIASFVADLADADSLLRYLASRTSRR